MSLFSNAFASTRSEIVVVLEVERSVAIISVLLVHTSLLVLTDSLLEEVGFSLQ